MTGPRKPSPRVVSDYATDPEMAELVELFISELPARVAAMDQAWSARKTADLKRLAHQLKGSCAGYGFPTLGQAAGALEAEIKRMDENTQSTEALASQFKQLIELCSRVCAPR